MVMVVVAVVLVVVVVVVVVLLLLAAFAGDWNTRLSRDSIVHVLPSRCPAMREFNTHVLCSGLGLLQVVRECATMGKPGSCLNAFPCLCCR